MSPRDARLAVDIFAALVVASIGVALAGLTWRVLGDPGQRLGAAPVAARPQRRVDLAPLVALAPFGTAAPVASAATDQSVILRGILLAEPRSASAAMISVNGAAPTPFYTGQSVGPGTIAEIAVDHVVFSAGGGQQTLAFPDRSSGGQATAAVGAPPSSGGSVAPPAPATPPLPAGATSTPTMNAGANLLGGLGTPAADGVHVGQPTAAMSGAGLRAGDVVTSINGSAAADAMRDPAAVQGAIAAGSAQLEVLRAGQRLTLSVPLR